MRALVTIKSAAICLFAVGLMNSARAEFKLYNTGVSADAVPVLLDNGTIGDPHYFLTDRPADSTDQILVRTEAGGYPIPPYLGDNGSSRWIGPNNDPNNSTYPNAYLSPPGTYTFATTFDLTGYDPLTASISGQWSSDNDGIGVYLNDAYLVGGPTSFAQFSAGFAAFTINAGFAGFLPGENTLTFVVHNGGNDVGNSSGENNPTALRVEFTSYSATAVPEASSFLVVGLGGILALGAIGVGKRYGISAKL